MRVKLGPRLVSRLRLIRPVVLGVAEASAYYCPMPGRLRAHLVRVLGVEVQAGVAIGRGVKFDNRNVVLGSGCRIGPGAHFTGIARITVQPATRVPGDGVLGAVVSMGTCSVISISYPTEVGVASREGLG